MHHSNYKGKGKYYYIFIESKDITKYDYDNQKYELIEPPFINISKIVENTNSKYETKCKLVIINNVEIDIFEIVNKAYHLFYSYFDVL